MSVDLTESLARGHSEGVKAGGREVPPSPSNDGNGCLCERRPVRTLDFHPTLPLNSLHLHF